MAEDHPPAPEHTSWFVADLVDLGRCGLALPAQIVSLLVDPDTGLRFALSEPVTGAVARQDPGTYRPHAALARFVRSRDGTCRFPGCATPARHCDLDHVTPYPDGATDRANLHALCRTHHGFKHHAGWAVQMTPHGICTWTAPEGRRHTTWPTDHTGTAAA